MQAVLLEDVRKVKKREEGRLFECCTVTLMKMPNYEGCCLFRG